MGLELLTLVAEKAFDTVNHDIMFNKLYQDGVEGDMWSLMNNMYKGMTFKVKWDNNLTDNINIAQGIRQVRNCRPSYTKDIITLFSIAGQ